MMKWNRVFLSLAALAALTGSFACLNIYDPIDNPHGDGQLLSAARAAFDKGDIATARELYGKVGDETARAETVFLDLDSCGADIGAFASALSKAADAASAPGIMFTVMAEKMQALHSTTCLATLLAAFKSSRAITDSNLRGFASFMAAVAIAGEVLASSTKLPADGVLDRVDLYLTPATCSAASACAGCNPPAGGDGIAANATVNLTTAPSIAVDWGTVKGAINAINTAIGELGIPSGPSNNLVAAFSLAVSTSQPVFRCALSEAGVGR